MHNFATLLPLEWRKGSKISRTGSRPRGRSATGSTAGSTRFNRGSTLQPASLHPWISPWNCCQIHPPLSKNHQKSRQTHQLEIHNFGHVPSIENLRHHYSTLHCVTESEIGSGRACGALGAEATCKLRSRQNEILNRDTS